ncbi:MerR family transcriptional regulator [Brevibacillus sp. B_LB10_24]|uniref:MerR family transcriptional regulator n=1 Tax=Brevibacillus sp. B_LB10_24 TaxID=3380645 RepID=UPI0038BA1EA9
MKIGAFARHFHISIDTVRYYTELGLLVPNKRESQLQFDQNCLDDMHVIIELKKMRFTLQEIHKILSLKRITQFSDMEDLHFLSVMLQEKQRQLSEERDQLNLSIEQIEEKLRSISRQITVENQSGVPLAFIPLLACPHCQKSLDLTDACIQNQEVFHASLHCSCGYQASIKEGILMTTSSVFYTSKLQYSIYDQNTWDDLTPSLVSLWEKGSMWIYKHVREQELAKRVILETNVDVYVFPPKHFATLPSDALYMFSGHGLATLSKLKNRIEQVNPDLRALYIVNSDMMLPIRYASIDLVLDTISFNDYSMFDQVYPLAKLKPYLTERAQILGNHMYYPPGARSLGNIPKLYPDPHPRNFLLDYMEQHIQLHGFAFQKREYIGFTTNPGKYLDYHIKGEKLHLVAYLARRVS